MASQSSDSEVPTGPLRPWDTWGDFNNINFLVRQALSGMQTATVVKVVACSNSGALSPVGTVDIIPMVAQLDALNNPTPHVTIFNVPYLRMQGGSNAIIMDPAVGDLGIAVFASRDISKVKATKAEANPGSLRQYSFSDAMYLGGLLNGTPEQYVQFSSAGINIVSPDAIGLQAPAITLDCETLTIDASTSVTMTTPTFQLNGAMSATGVIHSDSDVTAGNIPLKTHKHGGVTTGAGVSGGPLP